MLDQQEGYGRTVDQTPDLSARAASFHKNSPRTTISGSAIMAILGAAMLVLFLQPIAEMPSATEPSLLIREYDKQLNSELATMLHSAEIGPDGEVFFKYPQGNRKFLQQNSGQYWQVSGRGYEDFSSRSLVGRKLNPVGNGVSAKPTIYNSNQFDTEPLRVVEQTVRLPGSEVDWLFIVARKLN